MEKWAKSLYNKEKADKVKEYLEEKGRPLDKKPIKEAIPQKRQRFNLQGDRKTFIDDVIKFENKKNAQYPQREDKIEEMKDTLVDYYKNKKTPLEVTKEKYHVKGSLPKCGLIGIVSDAEHVGEKIPFCQLNENDEDDENKKNKFKTKITYPPVINLNFIDTYLFLIFLFIIFCF